MYSALLWLIFSPTESATFSRLRKSFWAPFTVELSSTMSSAKSRSVKYFAGEWGLLVVPHGVVIAHNKES